MLDYDDDLIRCWRHQDCKGCLAEQGCGWCPFVGISPPQTLVDPRVLTMSTELGVRPQ